MFKQKIQEFREACYVLFGFRIDMIGQQFKLKSMFAEKPSDTLLFSKQDDDEFILLENEYSKSLSKEIHAFLTTCHSIPAFLSHLTLDLFNNQTYLN
ncbi:mitotic spindle assembly checkpoint protein mad1 [Anaeramoeba ignava]|uniref:Mitotic spindle assembly checkpoint protein mad1 n=1 Tax=Anaeramoeba ignava TaxID=1746090 RepID=A0A9Q0L8L3_ANAIG|nr:mitotic spindle assembly checkpoint protein mad1 [Anaeramoeba ignava]